MHKHVLRSIEGIEIFPIIGLVIFTLFFIGLVFYAIKLSKPLVNRMENLPLEDGTSSAISNDLQL